MEDSNSDSLLEALETNLKETKSTVELESQLSPVLWSIAHELHEPADEVASEFAKNWVCLPANIRQSIVRALRTRARRKYASRDEWHSVKGIPLLMLKSNAKSALSFVAKSKLRVSFNNIWTVVLPGSYELASFGVRIPGGILDWNAATSTGRRWKLVPGGVTAHIDMLSGSNATLAANRLFLPVKNAEGIARKVNRAILRRAHDLYSQAPDNKNWQNWFEGIVESISKISPGAVHDERELTAWLQ
jgi:hypothetical protein